jgi:inward rectifier potassium channel
MSSSSGRPGADGRRSGVRSAGRKIRLSQAEITVQGLPRKVWQDLYHFCMTVSWPLMFCGFAACFVGFNLVFAALYSAVPGSVANLNPPGFAGAFFFSVETLATVGYGDMHPQTVYGHCLASVQIFIGTLYLALLTGIVFARFSRPVAKFLFARTAVVRPVDGRVTLMFRSANARHNVIVEASARLRMIYDDVTEEGFRLRRITDLKLVREEHPLFILGWNLMHVIDASSPLATATPEWLAARKAIFSLTLSGTDETTGQVLIGRAEYPSDAIRWNHSFRDVLQPDAQGAMTYDYSRFHDVVPLDGGQGSA